MDNDLKKAFESNMNGDKSSLRVYLINPPSENPWRTQGDYQEEQQEARERHAMFIEQHKSLMSQNEIISKSHRAVIVSAIFTGIIAISTCITMYFSVIQPAMKSKEQTQAQQVLSSNKPTDKKVDQK